jgi:hypothetical protein
MIGHNEISEVNKKFQVKFLYYSDKYQKNQTSFDHHELESAIFNSNEFIVSFCSNLP